MVDETSDTHRATKHMGTGEEEKVILWNGYFFFSGALLFREWRLGSQQARGYRFLLLFGCPYYQEMMLLQNSAGGTLGGCCVDKEESSSFFLVSGFCPFLTKCSAGVSAKIYFQARKGKGSEGYRVSVFVLVLSSL